MDQRVEPLAESSRHVYPMSAMIGDYARAAAGLLPSGALLVAVPLGNVAAVILGGFAAIFAIFGLRTALRHGTSLEMTAAGLRAYGLSRRTIAWSELDRVKLAYYSTRRDRKAGWMQLELGSAGARLGIDSRIGGFDRLVRRAAEAAAGRGIELSDATAANLEALGVRISHEERSR